jgi:hypothetical protein
MLQRDGNLFLEGKKKYWKILISINKEIKSYKWFIEYNKKNNSFVLKHIITAKKPPYFLKPKQPHILLKPYIPLRYKS